VRLVGYLKKSITMHGNMNIKNSIHLVNKCWDRPSIIGIHMWYAHLTLSCSSRKDHMQCISCCVTLTSSFARP